MSSRADIEAIDAELARRQGERALAQEMEERGIEMPNERSPGDQAAATGVGIVEFWKQLPSSVQSGLAAAAGISGAQLVGKGAKAIFNNVVKKPVGAVGRAGVSALDAALASEAASRAATEGKGLTKGVEQLHVMRDGSRAQKLKAVAKPAARYGAWGLFIGAALRAGEQVEGESDEAYRNRLRRVMESTPDDEYQPRPTN